MATIVEVYNLALSHIGIGIPVHDSDEKSEAARVCKLHYSHAVQSLLQKFPYNFSRVIISLAEVANDYQGKFLYAYDLPGDCLKVCGIVTPDGNEFYPIPYEIIGAVIYCDLKPAWLDYVTSGADILRYPPLFVEALSWELAFRIAMPLTRDSGLRREAYQMAETTRIAAEAADANNMRDTYDIPAAQIAARE